jgi:CBS domain-containing protein
MRRHLFTMLPIVDEEFRLRDVITLRDVLEFLATPARQSEGA